jgi:glycosyltransferase involved in cell wall biosynthesis
VLDADVLGRQRTGDETYVSSLLAELPRLAPDLRFAGVTRRPDLLPKGVEPIELPAKSQPLRMSWSLPRLLRRLEPALSHFQYVVAPRAPSPAVVTIHDLSFERDPGLMGRRDRFFFRTMVPRSARRADRVLAVSERTKRDLVELYGLDEAKVVVTPNGVDARFRPNGERNGSDPYLLFVGALQPRKDPVAAIQALALVDPALRLVLVGPDKGAEREAREAVARLGLNGRRNAEALVFPSRYEGFGLPVVEAMASGTPVVATSTGAVPEVAADAAILVEPGNAVALAGGIERALADRERLVRAGLERVKRYSWTETAQRTLEVYRDLL